MKLEIGRGGIVVLAMVAAYGGTLFAQGRAAERLCERYPVGTPVADARNLEGTFLLSAMGEFRNDVASSQEVIFCASMTLCDNACAIVIENGVVIAANHSSR